MTFEEFVTRAYVYIPPGTYWAIFDSEGRTLTSDLSQEAEQLSIKIIRAGMSIWDVGDYQVKALGGGRRLFIFKLTPDWALALESSEREGVLLHLARQLKNLMPKELPIPPLGEEAVEEVKPGKPPRPSAPPAEISPQMIPEMIPQPGRAVELSPEILTLLKLIDGKKDVLTLSFEMGMEPQRLMEIIGVLKEQGLLKLKEPPKVKGPVYELAPAFKSPGEALPLAGPSMKVRTVVLNLYRPLSISQIEQILKEAGLETSTEEVSSIMRNLEARGVVRKRQ